MGLILRTSHEPMPVGSTISNSRLTIEQMDSNFIFLQSISTNSVTITYNDAIDLINNNQVLKNINYIITDCDPSLYGASSSFLFGNGTEIIVQGLDTNSFSSQGYGKFYNPKYYDPNTDLGYDVWNPNSGYNLHDIVIYGGRVWRMTDYTENCGYDDYLNLQSDWTPFSYENPLYYNVVWDEVEYDIKDNYISSRYDVYNNNYVKNNYRTQYFYCNAYPIQVFRWGHRLDIGGLADCNIINSFFSCLNYPGSTNTRIYNITLENQSHVYDLGFYGDCFLYNIKLNNSGFGSIYAENCSFYNINLDNGTFLGNMEMDNSSIYYINMIDSYFGNMGISNTELYNIILSNSEFTNMGFVESEAYDIEIINNSQFTNNDIYGSSFKYIKIDNSSYYGNNTLYSSTIENINVLNNSNFQTNLLYSSVISNISVEGNSYFGNIYLNYHNDNNNSYISDIKISNNSYISNDDDDIYIDNGSYLQRITLDNNSYITGYLIINDHSNMNDISLTNMSNIDGSSGITLNYYSYIENISINNDSKLHGYLYINDNSGINRVSIDNDSSFGYGFSLDSGSYISNIEIIDDSSLAGFWENISLQNSSYMTDITVSGNSYIGNLYFDDNCYFYDVRVIEDSTIGNISLYDHSFIENLTTNRTSYLGDYIELNNSYISYCMINNNSLLSNIVFNSSYISNININEDSNINSNSSNNQLMDSHIENISLSNSSRLLNFNINSSIFNKSNLTKNSTLTNLIMSTGSVITKMDNNGSLLSNVNISNNSGIYSSSFINSSLEGNQVEGIGSFLLDNSSIISNVIFNNFTIHAYNTGIILQADSILSDSSLFNSSIYNTSCYNSSLNNLILNNQSSIYASSFSASSISNSELKTSSLGYLNLENTSLFGLFLKQSNFSNYTNNGTNIVNLLMNGSSLNLNSLGNINLTNTDMTFNTIKYQFSHNLAGSISGQYNLNVLIPGAGWYIEKIIVHSTEIVSTGSSILSLGLLNLNQTYVFSSVDTSVLSNKVKIYDISNGSLDGSVTTGIDYLNLNMGGDDIYSGVIYFDVVIKNTSFFNSND